MLAPWGMGVHMPETTGPALRRWLLAALADLGGAAPRRAVHARVEELFGSEFTAEDRRPRRGRPGGEQAWRNNLDSLYDRFKKSGLMAPSRAHDPWTLTDVGRQEATRHRLPAVSQDDLLSGFRPGSGEEYRTRLTAREIVSQRNHEPLLERYGTAASVVGWAPVTEGIYPRDLELRRGSDLWLVEVKVVYGGNATQAVRAVVGQLMEYRYYWYGDRAPGLLGVFSECIGKEHARYLDSIGICSAWEEQSQWDGSRKASEARLIPNWVPL